MWSWILAEILAHISGLSSFTSIFTGFVEIYIWLNRFEVLQVTLKQTIEPV